MKRFTMRFLEFSLLIFFLIACANGRQMTWVDKDRVSFTWDPVTTMANRSGIPDGHDVRYLIYIDYPDSHEGVLVGKYVNGVWVDKGTPITETSCTVTFKNKGRFLLGVQSVLCDKNTKIIERSVIAWSDNNIYTNNNPFGIQVER